VKKVIFISISIEKIRTFVFIAIEVEKKRIKGGKENIFIKPCKYSNF